MRLFMLIGALALLAGCAEPDVVSLRHPSTGKTAQCGPYTYNQGLGSRESAVLQERGCVADFQRQGYERVME